jgi:FkbM family methyltransferase
MVAAPKLHWQSLLMYLLRPVLGYGSACALGLLIAMSVTAPQWVGAVGTKITGGTKCSWPTVLTLPQSAMQFIELRDATRLNLKLVSDDNGIQLFETPTRRFSIKKDGAAEDGRNALAFVIAEQQWISSHNPGYGVRRGDVVVDVGAHVGTFGDDALRRGAAKVIMVEPDPVNVECIRRNFSKEIDEGRVVVVPEGAWSESSALDFEIGGLNSGTGSLVHRPGVAATLKVPVRRLDDILSDLGVDRVDFIKMDIEGAEREALKGMSGVLAKWKPRLMIDSYHLSDDDVVLPQVVTSLNPSYRGACNICSFQWDSGKPIPYVVFYD